MIRIASFDIGIRNFAQYVEECNLDILNELSEDFSKLPKSKQRKTSGPFNEEIKTILDKTCENGTLVEMGNYSFLEEGEKQTKRKSLQLVTRKHLFSHLTEFKHIWDTCQFIVIEQQFWTPKGSNMAALKLGEATLSWFLIHYPDIEIILFRSSHKTKVLGCPETKAYRRKKWSTIKALEILEQRKNTEAISLLSTYKKKDDISDTIIQCQAFKYLHFVAKI